jgi:hypothetical protein
VTRDGDFKRNRPKDASLILLGLRFEYPKLNNHFFFGASGHVSLLKK